MKVLRGKINLAKLKLCDCNWDSLENCQELANLTAESPKLDRIAIHDELLRNIEREKPKIEIFVEVTDEIVRVTRG